LGVVCVCECVCVGARGARSSMEGCTRVAEAAPLASGMGHPSDATLRDKRGGGLFRSVALPPRMGTCREAAAVVPQVAEREGAVAAAQLQEAVQERAAAVQKLEAAVQERESAVAAAAAASTDSARSVELQAQVRSRGVVTPPPLWAQQRAVAGPAVGAGSVRGGRHCHGSAGCAGCAAA
jgi:hypothetical protein